MNNQIKQISERIHELREILDISASDLAKKIGISLEDYMSYENAVADIPVSVLYNVASVLNTDPTVLLTGEAPRMGGYTVVRNKQGVEVERYSGYKFSSLAFNFINRDMEPMLVTLNEGSKPELVFHPGQEFNYVLEGSVNITIGKNKFILNKGDSIYFDAMLPHSQTTASGKARFITVINENSKGLNKNND